VSILLDSDIWLEPDYDNPRDSEPNPNADLSQDWEGDERRDRHGR
jgi:hypothetical protein